MSALLLAALLALATGDPPGFHYVERRSTYDIEANNLEQLRRRVREQQLHGPHDDPSSGMTTQRISASYEAEHVDGGCALRDIEVTLEVHIVLPRLVTRKAPGSTLVRHWELGLAGLTRHEEGHRDNARRAGLELLDRLRALPPAPCKALVHDADRVYDNVLGGLQLRDEIYDQRTEHGVRQGSRL